MASAQVLPHSAVSSRKQELLNAGKRRLEEFRKQKAAGRAKKAGKPHSDSVPNEKQLLNGEPQVLDSKAAGTSGRIGDPIGGIDTVVANDVDNLLNRIRERAVGLEIHTYADPAVPRSGSSILSNQPPAWPNHEESRSANLPGSIYPINMEHGQHKYEKTGQSGTVSLEERSWGMASSHRYSDYGHLTAKDALSDVSAASNEIPGAVTSYGYGVEIVPSERSGCTLLQNDSDSTLPIASSVPHPSDNGQIVREHSYFNKH